MQVFMLSTWSSCAGPRLSRREKRVDCRQRRSWRHWAFPGLSGVARRRVRRSSISFSAALRRIPTQLLEVERRRMGAISRGGHTSKNNCTSRTRLEVYRCCPPGCGGAVVNASKIRQPFRHHSPELTLVSHFELLRGWDIVSIPTARKGEPIPDSGLRTPRGGRV